MERDKEVWDLDRVLIATEADGSDLRGQFRKLQTESECLAVSFELPTGLVSVLRMTKPSIILEQQLRESDQELQKI